MNDNQKQVNARVHVTISEINAASFTEFQSRVTNTEFP